MLLPEETEDALRSEWGGDYRRNLTLVHSILDATGAPGFKDNLLHIGQLHRIGNELVHDSRASLFQLVEQMFGGVAREHHGERITGNRQQRGEALDHSLPHGEGRGAGSVTYSSVRARSGPAPVPGSAPRVASSTSAT